MIVVISCSSPVADVAILSEVGELLFEASQESHWNASEVCIQLLRAGLTDCQTDLRQVSLFVADVGPGSFIGARVGVTLAKAFAYANAALTAGVSAFDLINLEGTAVLPSRKDEYFIRPAGEGPYRSKELPDQPFLGYGGAIAEITYPKAAAVTSFFKTLTRMRPEELIPNYLIEPSISQPKKPYLQMESL